MQDIFDRGQATDVRAYGRSSPAVGGALPGTRAVRRVPMTADTISRAIHRMRSVSGQARPTPIFKFSPDNVSAEARSDLDENSSNLKMFEREDWTLFRTVEGLQQKAGVPAAQLRRLALKELADNALDTGSKVKLGCLDGDDSLFVQDSGPGLDGTPEQIAELFSISRSMRSSKLLRLPQRGALGNGLRVVAGAVLASEGSLAVITCNRRIVLRPQTDGSTAVVEVRKADQREEEPELDLEPAPERIEDVPRPETIFTPPPDRRELIRVALLAGGKSNRQIAAELNCSEATVRRAAATLTAAECDFSMRLRATDAGDDAAHV